METEYNEHEKLRNAQAWKVLKKRKLMPNEILRYQNTLRQLV